MKENVNSYDVLGEFIFLGSLKADQKPLRDVVDVWKMANDENSESDIESEFRILRSGTLCALEEIETRVSNFISNIQNHQNRQLQNKVASESRKWALQAMRELANNEISVKLCCEKLASRRWKKYLDFCCMRYDLPEFCPVFGRWRVFLEQLLQKLRSNSPFRFGDDLGFLLTAFKITRLHSRENNEPERGGGSNTFYSGSTPVPYVEKENFEENQSDFENTPLPEENLHRVLQYDSMQRWRRIPTKDGDTPEVDEMNSEGQNSEMQTTKFKECFEDLLATSLDMERMGISEIWERGLNSVILEFTSDFLFHRSRESRSIVPAFCDLVVNMVSSFIAFSTNSKMGGVLETIFSGNGFREPTIDPEIAEEFFRKLSNLSKSLLTSCWENLIVDFEDVVANFPKTYPLVKDLQFCVRWNSEFALRIQKEVTKLTSREQLDAAKSHVIFHWNLSRVVRILDETSLVKVNQNPEFIKNLKDSGCDILIILPDVRNQINEEYLEVSKYDQSLYWLEASSDSESLVSDADLFCISDDELPDGPFSKEDLYSQHVSGFSLSEQIGAIRSSAHRKKMAKKISKTHKRPGRDAPQFSSVFLQDQIVEWLISLYGSANDISRQQLSSLCSRMLSFAIEPVIKSYSIEDKTGQQSSFKDCFESLSSEETLLNSLVEILATKTIPAQESLLPRQKNIADSFGVCLEFEGEEISPSETRIRDDDFDILFEFLNLQPIDDETKPIFRKQDSLVKQTVKSDLNSVKVVLRDLKFSLSFHDFVESLNIKHQTSQPVNVGTMATSDRTGRRQRRHNYLLGIDTVLNDSKPSSCSERDREISPRYSDYLKVPSFKSRVAAFPSLFLKDSGDARNQRQKQLETRILELAKKASLMKVQILSRHFWTSPQQNWQAIAKKVPLSSPSSPDLDDSNSSWSIEAPTELWNRQTWDDKEHCMSRMPSITDAYGNDNEGDTEWLNLSWLPQPLRQPVESFLRLYSYKVANQKLHLITETMTVVVNVRDGESIGLNLLQAAIFFTTNNPAKEEIADSSDVDISFFVKHMGCSEDHVQQNIRLLVDLKLLQRTEKSPEDINSDVARGCSPAESIDSNCSLKRRRCKDLNVRRSKRRVSTTASSSQETGTMTKSDLAECILTELRETERLLFGSKSRSNFGDSRILLPAKVFERVRERVSHRPEKTELTWEQFSSALGQTIESGKVKNVGGSLRLE
eukprot:GHVP01061002.1.p1 GENE.GHVP01061002.1~~GHVP01061002.1.p1  ORF type:complete len:1208 (-),score=233.16 GHVP01061002.1:665-4288(-)